MRRVIVESPFRGKDTNEQLANEQYLNMALHDCVAHRRETPYASHGLLTRRGVLDDADPDERSLGISAGLCWYKVAEGSAFYLDRGMSSGMEKALLYIRQAHPATPVEFRFLMPPLTYTERDTLKEHFDWQAGFAATAPHWDRVAEMKEGRLEIGQRGKTAPNPRAPFQVLFKTLPRKTGGDGLVAYYGSLRDAITGAERYYLWRVNAGNSGIWP